MQNHIRKSKVLTKNLVKQKQKKWFFRKNKNKKFKPNLVVGKKHLIPTQNKYKLFKKKNYFRYFFRYNILFQAVRPRNCSHVSYVVKCYVRRHHWNAILLTNMLSVRRNTVALYVNGFIVHAIRWWRTFTHITNRDRVN